MSIRCMAPSLNALGRPRLSSDIGRRELSEVRRRTIRHRTLH